jgi:hypothetical protein
MSKSSFLIILALVSWLSSLSFAADTSIIDALNRYNETNNPTLTKPNFQLTEFSSCEDMSQTLTTFIKENSDYFQSRGGYYPMPMRWGVAMEDSLSNAMVAKSSEGWSAAGVSVSSSTRDFSTTNNQVAGVDEPDIMKTDGKHFYYVNERTKAIDIIKSPLDTISSTINLNQAKLVNELKIPQSFRGTQLFLKNNTLIIIGQRYRDHAWTPRFLDTHSRTTVLMFDMTDVMKPKFLSLKDLPWNFHDARLVEDKVILVQQLYANRWWWYDYWRRGMEMDSTLTLPSSIDVSRSSQGTKINNKTLPVSISKTTPACDAISYALPDKETLKHFNLDPNFTIISTLDIKHPDSKVSTTITIGATQSIHVSSENIYLAQWLYSPSSWACPMNARCIMPRFDAGQQTLLHKFTLNPLVSYTTSNMVQGSPLTQYAMSEDQNGNFRLLTTQRNEQQSTHLFTFDNQLNPLGKLTNIEPGESFQSSRFIEDKLYLVTFEQIDPLFVIDLKNLQEPRIIWELKIPGYSSYLHPWGKQENGTQYLIGLWFDTAANPWWGGGIINSGIKIDLYKIDFNSKNASGMIQVFQTASKTLGWMDSQTEATYNPRSFVWDNSRKQLLLPLSLTNSVKTQQCSVNYDEFGKELVQTKQCYPNFINTITFAWMKLFHITPELGVVEKISVDYRNMLKKDTNFINEYSQEINPRQFQSYMNRVWYAGDVIFTINQLFGHFSLLQGNQEQYISLDNKTPIK